MHYTSFLKQFHSMRNAKSNFWITKLDMTSSLQKCIAVANIKEPVRITRVDCRHKRQFQVICNMLFRWFVNCFSSHFWAKTYRPASLKTMPSSGQYYPLDNDWDAMNILFSTLLHTNSSQYGLIIQQHIKYISLFHFTQEQTTTDTIWSLHLS